MTAHRHKSSDGWRSAIIRVAGITGRIRGTKFKRPDGHTVRPSLVVLGCAVGASIEGAVLPGTQDVAAPKRERIKLSELRHGRR
jgi:hypothetical protein